MEGRAESTAIDADIERAVPEIIRELANARGLTFDLELLADIYNDGRVDSLPEGAGALVGGTVKYDEALTTEEALRRIAQESKGYTPATVRQLLTLALHRPQARGVALGSEVTLKGRRYVFSLSMKDGVPALEVVPNRREATGEAWEPGTEFVMVRRGVA